MPRALISNGLDPFVFSQGQRENGRTLAISTQPGTNSVRKPNLQMRAYERLTDSPRPQNGKQHGNKITNSALLGKHANFVYCV